MIIKVSLYLRVLRRSWAVKLSEFTCAHVLDVRTCEFSECLIFFGAQSRFFMLCCISGKWCPSHGLSPTSDPPAGRVPSHGAQCEPSGRVPTSSAVWHGRRRHQKDRLDRVITKLFSSGKRGWEFVNVADLFDFRSLCTPKCIFVSKRLRETHAGGQRESGGSILITSGPLWKKFALQSNLHAWRIRCDFFFQGRWWQDGERILIILPEAYHTYTVHEALRGQRPLHPHARKNTLVRCPKFQTDWLFPCKKVFTWDILVKLKWAMEIFG